MSEINNYYYYYYYYYYIVMLFKIMIKRRLLETNIKISDG